MDDMVQDAWQRQSNGVQVLLFGKERVGNLLKAVQRAEERYRRAP